MFVSHDGRRDIGWWACCGGGVGGGGLVMVPFAVPLGSDCEMAGRGGESLTLLSEARRVSIERPCEGGGEGLREWSSMVSGH